MRRLFVLIGVSVLVFSGCKRLKELTSGNAAWKAVEQRALNEHLDFTAVTLSGKARLNYPDGGFNNLSASYRINMIQDSLIMIRVIKLIEAARILITTDSVYIQNRINQELIVCDFAVAEEFLGLPADFGLLQDMLLGQYHPIPDNMTVVEKRGTPKTFEGRAAGLTFQYQLDSELAKPTMILATDPETDRAVSISYDAFSTTREGTYPNRASIEATGENHLSVTFSHRKVSFSTDQRLASFDVPSGYTRSTCE